MIRECKWTLQSQATFQKHNTDLCSMSGLLTLPSFERQFPQTADGFEGSKSSALQSLLVAIYELGCMAGALSNLWVGDRIGRRHTIAL